MQSCSTQASAQGALVVSHTCAATTNSAYPDPQQAQEALISFMRHSRTACVIVIGNLFITPLLLMSPRVYHDDVMHHPTHPPVQGSEIPS